jgi:hypothetical protein
MLRTAAVDSQLRKIQLSALFFALFFGLLHSSLSTAIATTAKVIWMSGMIMTRVYSTQLLIQTSNIIIMVLVEPTTCIHVW